MSSSGSILISLDGRHADNVFTGTKTVEFRRRPMRIERGTTIWVYVKKPVGMVIGRAQVSDVFHLAPSSLWRKFRTVSGLDRDEFFKYFEGVQKGFAISLVDVERLVQPVNLASLRNVSAGFQPPQFFMRIDHDGPIFGALMGPHHNDVELTAHA